MGPRAAAFGVLRRLSPRTVRSLEAVPDLVREVEALRRRTDEVAGEVVALRRDLDTTREVLDDARRRAGVADDAIAALVGRVEGLESGVAELDSGLAESRRLSRRVAQMTDLVFDRLGASPSDVAER
ncbi:hypothetical protein [Blastococcus sp. SYSU D00695]